MSATTTHLAKPVKVKKPPKGRTKPDQYGRIKETWPPVPVPRAGAVLALEEWLREHRQSVRSLPVCAPLLAIVCELHEMGREYYLPTRERLAEAIEQVRQEIDPPRRASVRKGLTPRTSVHAIDAALSTAAGHEDTFEEYRTEEGDVTRRKSIRRRRYVHPSKQLLAVWHKIVRRIDATEADEAADTP